jgi:hypothetical protein
MAKRKNPDQLMQGAAARDTREAKPTRSKATSIPGSPKTRRLDILKGQFTVPPEFFEPLPGEELDSCAAAHARDLERINAAVNRLNAEAEEVMEYQPLNT